MVVTGLMDTMIFPKIGPSLNNLLVKTYPGWIYRWVLNPREYLPNGRMPHFFLSPEEAEAITAYLVKIGQDSAKNWEYKFKYAGGGNPARGKELVENIGCLGCHAIGENKVVRETRGLNYDIAPELTKVGSKVNPQWLYDWLKNPRHYLPNTKMPSLRLTDQEASDIVAYLMTLKDTVNYSAIKIDVTPEKAEQGLRLIKSYGCYGCHDIKGTEKEAKVSVDISDFARKNIEQLDFGYKEQLPKDRLVWVSEKLRDPRGYSTERIQLKMPKFNFTDKEINALVTLIASFKKNEVGSKYVQAFDKKRREINEGRRLTTLV
jgi:cytochrome c2